MKHYDEYFTEAFRTLKTDKDKKPTLRWFDGTREEKIIEGICYVLSIFINLWAFSLLWDWYVRTH